MSCFVQCIQTVRITVEDYMFDLTAFLDPFFCERVATLVLVHVGTRVHASDGLCSNGAAPEVADISVTCCH